MSRLLYRAIIALVLLMSMIVLLRDADPARACSSGGIEPSTDLDLLVSESTIIVKANILRTDLGNRNAILNVERYLKGTGGNTIFLVQAPPIEDYRYRVGFGNGSCVSNGARLFVGDAAYFFLVRKLDGTYTNTTRNKFEDSVFQFQQVDDRILILLPEAEDSTGPKTTVNESEFVQMISELAKTPPSAPVVPSEVPFTAPILIKTQAGKSYLMPVDRGPLVALTVDLFPTGRYEIFSTSPTSIPDKLVRWAYGLSISAMDTGVVACDTMLCDALQPNGGVGTAVILNNGRLLLDNMVYLSADSLMADGGVRYPSQKEKLFRTTVPGIAFMYSPTDKIAVWGEQGLTIYSTPPYSINWDLTKGVRRSAFMVPRNAEYACRIDCAVWSQDGTRFAFTDSRGLWIWNLSTPDRAPELFMGPQGGILPRPRQFTTLNGYLTVTVGNKANLIKIADKSVLPNIILPPNEDLFGLIAYDIYAEYRIPCTFSCYGSTFELVEPVSSDYEMIKFRWLGSAASPTSNDKNYFGAAVICEKRREPQCVIRLGDVRNGWYGSRTGFDFDYSAENGMIVVKDRYTLVIDRDYILSTEIDSPIVSAKWLPSQMSSVPDDVLIAQSR